MNTLNPGDTGRKAGADDGGELFSPDRLGSLIPRRRYAATLGLHPRTVARYERSDPDFPRVIFLRGRAFITSED